MESPQNKIEPLDVDDAFSSLSEYRKQQDEESNSVDITQPRLSCPCFAKSVRLTFTSPKLEKMYKHSNTRERLKSNILFALIATVVNIVLLIYHAIRCKEKKHYDNVLAIHSVFLIGFLFLFVLIRRQRATGYSSSSSLVWIWAAMESLFILRLGETPLTPSDLVGVVTFLAFLAFILLPLRLRVCLLWVCSLVIVHSVIVAVSSTEHLQYLGQQITANILLFLCAGLMGVIDFLMADRRQRQAFSETLESLKVKTKLQVQYDKQRRLLLSVLPKYLFSELETDIQSDGTILKDNNFNRIYIQRVECCSILYADIVGFTELSSRCTAEELIVTLNKLFAIFDKLASKHNCQRIKILGDCYYCIAGLDNSENHAKSAVNMGLGMITHISKVRRTTGVSSLDMRVGIHTGAVLVGVLGKKKWQFDAWSNDVTLANKMESGGIPGRVHISSTTYDLVRDYFEVEEGNGHLRNDYIKQCSITTYLIVRKIKSKAKEKWETVPLLVMPDNETKRRTSSPIVTLIGSTRKALRTKETNGVEIVVPERKPKVEITVTERTEDSFEKSEIQDRLKDEEHLLHNLEEVLNEKERNSSKINAYTLNFVNPENEEKYARQSSNGCAISLSALCIVLIFAFLVELTIIPRSVHQNISFPVVFFLLLSFVLIRVAFKINKYLPDTIVDLSQYLERNKFARTSLAMFAVLFLIASVVLDMVACDTDGVVIGVNSTLSKYKPSHEACFYPLYFSFIALLVLLGISLMVQLTFYYKFGLMLLVTILYWIMNTVVVPEIYDNFDKIIFKKNTSYRQDDAFSQSKYTSSIIITICMVVLTMHCRQTAKTAKTFFVWKLEAEESKQKIDDIREKNQVLIHNILPSYVAKHFLQNQDKDETELYSHSYENVSVMFASIPNFDEFYSEDNINNKGVECMRFLNEVISDFDELLDDSRFSDVEKIKTICSTYMAASGLASGLKTENQNKCHSWKPLVDLVDFALALKERLKEINQESFNEFVLRVGLHCGPVVGGVIGAKKPHYDIWGNTVNVASRMDSTGKGGNIQIIENTYEILKDKGYKFIYRGLVKVKGKGTLTTYYLTGKEDNRRRSITSVDSLPNTLNTSL